MATKTGISLKLDPKLIKQLNSIADIEDRTLSNQISYFVKRSLADYVLSNNLIWSEEYTGYFTQEELKRKKIEIPF